MNNFTTLNNPKHLVVLGRPEPKRFNVDVWTSLCNSLATKIRNALGIPRSTFVFVKSTRNRKSFGDIDIIINQATLTEKWRPTFAASVLGSKFFAEIPGTDTTVFEYQGYQVNVHLYTGNIAQAENYFRNEGAGELFNIMLENVGLTYTPSGTFLKTGIESDPILEVDVDPSQALRMAGLSSDNLENYVYNTNDIFSILCSSYFFNRQAFLDLEANTERVSKSPILANFIKYLKDNPELRGEIKFNVNDPSSAKTMMLNFKSFAPATLSKYTEMVQRNKIEVLFNDKFNPEKVSALTELTGETNIRFMNSFADTFKDDQAFKKFVLTSLPETLNKALLAHKAETIKPEVEAPKLVGKAKAKAKAVAKKAKEPELPPAKLAKVAKTPATKAASKKKVIITSPTGDTTVTVTPEMEAAAWPHPPSDNSPSPWPYPSPRA